MVTLLQQPMVDIQAQKDGFRAGGQCTAAPQNNGLHGLQRALPLDSCDVTLSGHSLEHAYAPEDQHAVQAKHQWQAHLKIIKLFIQVAQLRQQIIQLHDHHSNIDGID